MTGSTASPAGPRGWLPLPLQGRWVAAITAAVSGSTSAANVSGEQLAIQVQVRALGAVRVGEWHWSERRRHQTVPEDLGLEELLDALSFVGHPPSDEDQRLHLLVAGGGVGDDRAAVGVADQDHRTGDGPQQGRQGGGVADQVTHGLAAPMAANPRSPRARIDPPKPVASAHAPWRTRSSGSQQPSSPPLLC
jgi:hypothetical protein